MIAPEEIAENWRRYSSRLLLIARAIGEPAEDAVQEAFLALARQSTLPSDPLAWLVAVTRNQILQWHRSGDRRRKREQQDSVDRWFDTSIASLDDELDAQNVSDALRDLDASQRQIIVMHLWGGMTFETIAGLLSISRSTAHRTYKAGIRQMRIRFNPESNSVPGVAIND